MRQGRRRDAAGQRVEHRPRSPAAPRDRHAAAGTPTRRRRRSRWSARRRRCWSASRARGRPSGRRRCARRRVRRRRRRRCRARRARRGSRASSPMSMSTPSPTSTARGYDSHHVSGSLPGGQQGLVVEPRRSRSAPIPASSRSGSRATARVPSRVDQPDLQPLGQASRPCARNGSWSASPVRSTRARRPPSTITWVRHRPSARPAPTAAANEANASRFGQRRVARTSRDRLGQPVELLRRPAARRHGASRTRRDRSGAAASTRRRRRRAPPAATNRVSSRTGARTSTVVIGVRSEQRPDQHAHRQGEAVVGEVGGVLSGARPGAESAVLVVEAVAGRRLLEHDPVGGERRRRHREAEERDVRADRAVNVGVLPIGGASGRRRGRRPIPGVRVEVDDRGRVATEQRSAERHDRLRRRGRRPRPRRRARSASGHVLIGTMSNSPLGRCQNLRSGDQRADQRDVAPAQLGGGLAVRPDEQRLDEGRIGRQADHIALVQVAGARQHPVRGTRRQKAPQREVELGLDLHRADVGESRAASTAPARRPAGGPPSGRWLRPTAVRQSRRGRADGTARRRMTSCIQPGQSPDAATGAPRGTPAFRNSSIASRSGSPSGPGASARSAAATIPGARVGTESAAGSGSASSSSPPAASTIARLMAASGLLADPGRCPRDRRHVRALVGDLQHSRHSAATSVRGRAVRAGPGRRARRAAEDSSARPSSGRAAPRRSSTERRSARGASPDRPSSGRSAAAEPAGSAPGRAGQAAPQRTARFDPERDVPDAIARDRRGRRPWWRPHR